MTMTEPASTLLARYAERQDPDLAEAIVAEAWPIAYQTCRKALGDAQRAEDAAQEAMIKLLELADRFEAHRALRPWVATLAANAARVQRRGERRRARREEAVAKLDQAAGAADRLELDEVRAAVEALPETLREPVRLRYYSGLTYPEVAEALDLPEGTVATRIRQGKAKLKRRLERAGYATPSVIAGLGWLQAPLDESIPAAPTAAALGLALTRPRATPPVGSRAGRAGGKALVAALTALVGVGVAVATLLGGDARGPEVAQAEPAAPGGGAGQGGAAGGEPEGGAATAPAGSPAGAARVVGPRRVRGRLTPAAGLAAPWVLLHRLDDDPASADADYEDYAQRAPRLGRDAGLWVPLPVHASHLGSQPGGEFDPETGRFSVPLEPGDYALIAGARGRANTCRRLTVDAESPAELELELAVPNVPAAHVTWELVDETGAVVPDAQLFLSARGAAVEDLGEIGHAELATDGDGRFTVWQAAGELELELLTLAPLVSDTRVERSLRSGEHGLERVVLRNSARAEWDVTVVDAAGQPVEGALVRTRRAELDDLNPRRAPAGQEGDATDAAGRVRVETAHGARVVVAWREGLGWGISDPVTVSHDASARVVLDRALPTGSLRLQLVSADEAMPLPERWYGLDLVFDQRFVPRSVQLGEAPGEVILGGVPVGERVLVLAFQAEDSWGRRREWALTRPCRLTVTAGGAERAPVEVEVAPRRGDSPSVERVEAAPREEVTRAWTLAVVDAIGQPVAGAQGEAYAVESQSARFETDASGVARVVGWKPRLVMVMAEGYAPRLWLPGAKDFADGAARLTLRPVVPGASVLRGRVVDAQGWPLAGAEVTAWGQGPGRPAQVRTALDGTFTLERAPAGRVRLFAYRGDLGFSAVHALEAPAGAELEELGLTLQAGARVRGQVEGLRGRQPEFMLCDELQQRVSGELDVQPDGRFDLGFLPAGAWRLTLFEPGYAPLDFVVGAGGEQTLVLEPR